MAILRQNLSSVRHLMVSCILAFRQNCSEIAELYAYTFSGKNVAQGTQFLAVEGFCRYSRGFAGDGASNESVVV